MTAAIVKFLVAWLALVAFLAVHLVAFSVALHAFSWWAGAAVVIVTFSSAFGIFFSPMWGWVLETAYPWERSRKGSHDQHREAYSDKFDMSNLHMTRWYVLGPLATKPPLRGWRWGLGLLSDLATIVVTVALAVGMTYGAVMTVTGFWKLLTER